ncbi:hypothetical protein [Agrobacterium tumefaciens]|uniref:hypothetical protein n=1 Tax=Agrobacterium tumefaciens TaxID=358 RepID=UPI001574E833|nr:hypothetical protein [Agrobacterium tumefaciens]
MSIDKERLKKLAEACPQTDPLRLVDYSGTWYLRNTAGTVFEVRRNSSFPEFKSVNEAYAALAEAVSPVVLLDLLRDMAHLKSESEALRKDADRYRWLCQNFAVTKLPCAVERMLAGEVYVADGKAGVDAAVDEAMAKMELL